MKNLYKILLTLVLILSLVLSATACELLTDLDIDSILGTTDALPDDGDKVVGDLDDADTDDGIEDDTQGGTPSDDPAPDPIPDLIGTPSENYEQSGIIYIKNEEDPVISDPYENVDKDEFYADYIPAVSYMDAYYRTQHGLMSGSIDEQDQAPTISPYLPSLNGKLIRNTSYIYSEDGNTYYVIDAYGDIVNKIYKGGAYITLEEVAAYVFAFGEPPANHAKSKSTKPTASVWGIYLRVNNTKFSGDTTKYPYEPKLPGISGCGGPLTYYEMDVGTTGTDCDPSYDVVVYNNGTKITRGAARIVYTRYDQDRDGVIEIDETYLFYTYNHYNDFREYLNYEGGWGKMFGNVTGGGTLSSKYNYNPTPYVQVEYASLVNPDGTPAVQIAVVIAWLPEREEV